MVMSGPDAMKLVMLVESGVDSGLIGIAGIVGSRSDLNDVALSLALLLSTADCDDITADIIIADPSSCLLIRLTSYFLITASSNRNADLNVLQQIVQHLFAKLLSFLRYNTSRNSWFTFIAIAGKRCLRLVVQTLVLKPGDMMCLRLVVQLVVTIPFESMCLQLLSADIADVIVADHNYFPIAMMTSSSLIPALLNNRNADVIIAEYFYC
ncbi:hypothetical protein F511_33455 [Dorcoceras hygrometricum]|uniref:Uncharacterized protein n=1 Tax=Dorcoceras hygrometricum TaxID=472368 RepID=A0A2Z7BEU2_9LAMI|nr:hypothetical protein F511_33455 [Dorcoceras hygrometricum]